MDDRAEHSHGQDNLITTQINTAVANLGATREGNEPNLTVRTGGTLTLEQVAQSHPRHNKMVYELLCSYVRQEAPRYAPDSDEEPSDYAEGYYKRPRDDIQTAMTIIGRRPLKPSLSSHVLRLDATYLRGTKLAQANLQQVSLDSSDLSNSYCNGACLSKASLRSTNLSGARMQTADLTEASIGAADLNRANITGADLSNVIGEPISIDYARGNGKTKLPPNLTRPKHWRRQ